MKNFTLKDFKDLPQKQQDYCIEEYLPVLNHINNHMLSIEEVYIMLEVIQLIIDEKCLLSDNLRKYLKKKL